MPSAPPKACSTPACRGYAASRGKCQQCARTHERSRRATDRHKFYDSPSWRALRSRVRQEEPLCRECLSRGEHRFSTVIDHIVDLDIAPELRLVRDNLQAMCHSCHSRKTMAAQNQSRDLMR